MAVKQPSLLKRLEVIMPVEDTDYEEDYPDPPVARRVCTSAACIQAANGIIQNMDPRYYTIEKTQFLHRFLGKTSKTWFCKSLPQ